MKIYIDQSGKIERTDEHTVLAISNHDKFAILITAKTKRKIQEIFRKQGKPRLFIYKTFSIGIVLLLQYYPSKLNGQIIIDKEYPGKEKLVKDIVCNTLLKLNKKIPEIIFKQIGKKSNAHIVAYRTAINKRKAERIIGFKEIEKLINIKTKTPNA